MWAWVAEIITSAPSMPVVSSILRRASATIPNVVAMRSSPTSAAFLPSRSRTIALA